MRSHAITALVLAACSSSYTLPTEPDASPPPASDGGAEPDSSLPARPPCEPGLVAERGRCVGWLPAASLPFEVHFAGDPADVRPPRVVRIAWSGELVVQSGDGALYRYLPADDRFEEVPATAVLPAGAPSDALPAVPEQEYGRVLGWLDDGTRVITHVRYYAVEWMAERDDHGDGTWRDTIQPPPFFHPRVAYPIGARAILFAGRTSGIYLAAP